MGCGCSSNKQSNIKEPSDTNNLKPRDLLAVYRPGDFVQQNQQNFNRIYTMRQELQGEYHICQHNQTGFLRMVKIVRKENKSNSQISKIRKEIALIKEQDYPYIIKLFEYFEDEKRFFLILEHIEGKELLDWITEQNFVSELWAAQIICQLLQALAYLHSKQVIHRDVRADNIYILQTGQNISIKLANFGCATTFVQYRTVRGQVGSVYYMAPEVIEGNYSEKCDIWSCGILMYLILCGYPPFNGSNEQEIIQRVQEGKFQMREEIWKDISSEAKDLIYKMLSPARARISAQDALQHSWIVNAQSTQVSDKALSQVLENLKNFYSGNKFKDIIQMYITSQYITQQETEELRQIFFQLDLNNDGKLSKEELLYAYQNECGGTVQAELIENIMHQVDADGNGLIDYSEFLKATVDASRILSNKYLEAAFSLFDKDLSGKISQLELKETLSSVLIQDDTVWKQIIDSLDTDQDGEIDFEEFKGIIKTKFSED